MAQLLVSVRSVVEAVAAFEGGAALIDVKEPGKGPLGKADDTTIAQVVRFIAGRRPISAALGELHSALPYAGTGLAYVKWGLAGWEENPGWAAALEQAAAQLPPECRAVAVAYADHHHARAPQPDAIVRFVVERRWPVLLIDTWLKEGQTLLDWMTPLTIAALGRRCRSAGVRLALAGSLTEDHLRRLKTVEPDWFAVRGAACWGGRRGQEVCPERVRRLAATLLGEA